MGQITKEFAETLLKRTEDGKHINTTVHEEQQLIYAWLALHAGRTWPGMPQVCTKPCEYVPDDGGITQALVAMARENAIEECRKVVLSCSEDAEEAAKAKDATDYVAGYQDAVVDCDEALRALSCENGEAR